jgi:DNA-binding response OmpR family regulator
MKKKILVVDDDPDIRDSLRIILENRGFQIRLARNGQQALELLRADRPDLMILDVMMSSDTEGFDLAYELRKTPEFSKLPILLLTGFLDKVRSDGPDAWQHVLGEPWPAEWMFEKPVDTDRLLKKIDAVLSDL